MRKLVLVALLGVLASTGLCAVSSVMGNLVDGLGIATGAHRSGGVPRSRERPDLRPHRRLNRSQGPDGKAVAPIWRRTTKPRSGTATAR